MSATNSSTSGQGGVLGVATTATIGAVSLPFTGTHHTVSIVALVAIAVGVLVLSAHILMRTMSFFVAEK